jgi:hypothetical protein
LIIALLNPASYGNMIVDFLKPMAINWRPML